MGLVARLQQKVSESLLGMADRYWDGYTENASVPVDGRYVKAMIFEIPGCFISAPVEMTKIVGQYYGKQIREWYHSKQK